MKMLRRGMAMLLSIALVFSLVAVVASPNWTNATSLGLLSRYYETGKTNTDAEAAKMISTVAGDPGGKSYGAYMFASKSGTVKAFVDWCLSSNAANTAAYAIGEKLSRAYYSGGEGCGPLFDQAWLEVATDYGSAFFTVQEDFSKSQIYDKAIGYINAQGTAFNINNYSVALKNVIWSRAVHHGPQGAASIVADAFASLGGFANQAERDIIMAIYAQSGKVVDEHGGAEKMNGSLAAKYDVDGKVLRYWYGSSPGVQLAVFRRLFVNEPADALSMLQTNAFVGAPLSEGNYTIALKKDSSTLALGMTNSAIKVINTADANLSPAKFTLHYLSGVGAYTINTIVDGSTLRLAAGTADASGFGSVTLVSPSTSETQLWYIDSNGSVKNKATGTYLAYRNDTLVVVGTEGADTTQTVTATPSSDDKTETFTYVVTPANAENNTSEVSKSLNVTFVTGEHGTIAADSTASFVAGENADFKAEHLHSVTANPGWSFVGWFTKDDMQVTGNAIGASGELTLYAKYTATSKTSPSAWIFSPVVADVSDFAVHQLIYPDANTELHQGDSSFPVRGMISCSGTISNVTLTISGPKTLSKSVAPNASHYDLNLMDSSISYSSLTQGDYVYKLTATVGSTTYTLKESSFKVGAVVTPDVTTPTGGDKFTVTFNAGDKGTSSYTEKTYALDNIVYGELPTVNVKSGSVEFVGWFTSDGVQILPGTPIVAENITLYARYTNEYTYTFLKATSGTYHSGSAAAGTVFTTPATAPTKSPDSNYTYTFSHWVDAVGNKYSSSQAIVMGEANMTFTPVYTQKAIPTTPSGGSTGGTSGGSTGGSGTSGGSTGGGGSSTTTTPSGPVWTITPGVSVSQMDGTVYSGGKVVSSGNMATGMVVKTASGEYTVAVTGDTSGDGKITVTDVVKLQSHLLNKNNLSGAYLEAGDLNGDSKVSITDLVKSARVVASKDTIG